MRRRWFRPSTVSRSVRSRSLSTGRALAVTVAMLVGVGAAAPAFAGTDAGHPSASSSPSDHGFLRFRLPYLDGIAPAPDFPNLARAAARPAPLLLFLPATGAVPDDYRAFLATAAAVGYSVIGLDYPNLGRSVTRTCLGDAKCYTMLQRNRFTGADPSRFSHVTAANSITNRFRATVHYLEQHDPSGRWGRYLQHGHIDWSRIVVAGHSQGGGESAFIAHYNRVQGVLMFSSPVESYDNVTASWIDGKGATPVSRMFGFDVLGDIYQDRIAGSWRKLGLGTDHDPVAVPTGGHALLSSLPVGSPIQTHGRSVDDRTPRGANGVPVFAPTWRWMLDQVRQP
ncbi:BPSS1187 family protein [Lacisediminihabitans changchengi]|uniref:Alpha/beta hydrolase n=1 Tax=Lacisediminihabitans changchengi TaxID=2787634 RepID=A0A934W2L7_9MICO|nr:hypothetical protein [Lacisediminihabitans changchengi]MBK4346829.1 hypothetical protein [Lacisediminihabitans changchengi]MBK4348048.1 hypothetical protein [Lacisediminihabitans changchengi]